MNDPDSIMDAACWFFGLCMLIGGILVWAFASPLLGAIGAASGVALLRSVGQEEQN